MSVLSKIPAVNTATKIVDIKDTLNGNNGIVNDNLTTFFSASANINMWSKRKPVISTKVGTLTDAEMAVAGDKSLSFTTTRYGLNIVGGAAVTPADIYMYAGPAGLGGGALYYLPKGGESEPLRLSDFNGYYPAATQPLRGSLSGVVTIDPLSSDTASYKFDFIKSMAKDEGELGFDDLYPSKDENGNEITWRTGLILVDKSNASNKYIAMDSITGYFTRTYKGKKFYAVQFITSMPSNVIPLSATDQKWKSYIQYAIPDGYFELHINNVETGGNVGVSTSIKILVNTGFPKFVGLDTNPISYVSIKFQLSIVGGTGNIKSLGVGLYPNSNCSSNEEIDYVSFGSYTGITGTRNLSAMLHNSTTSGNLYTCIWLDGNRQQINKVATPVIERPTML